MSHPTEHPADLPADAVLLDIDGTLLDSTYHHAVAWQRALVSVGRPVPLWRVHRCVGMGGDRLVAAVGGDDAEERDGDAVRDRWREEYLGLRHEVITLPGAAALVDDLHRRGLRVALASSGDPQFADEALELLDVRDRVEVLSTAEDAEESKPAASLLEVTLQRLPGVRRAVLVGDTPYDVESAGRLGLRCVALRSGGYATSELTDAGAALVADGPEDLVRLDWEPLLAPVPS